jgi:hypothetical protein
MRLSDEEYDRRLVALYAGLPPVPSKEQQRQVRTAALNLAIDYRLGRDFPEERRRALASVDARVEKRVGRLILWRLVRKIFPRSLDRHATGVAGYLVSEYGEVLTPEELTRFFGEPEARNPRLQPDWGSSPPDPHPD